MLDNGVITVKRLGTPDLDIDYLAELDEELPNDLGDSITYKVSSPYGRHFKSALNIFKILVNDLENKYSNSLHFEENQIIIITIIRH